MIQLFERYNRARFSSSPVGSGKKRSLLTLFICIIAIFSCFNMPPPAVPDLPEMVGTLKLRDKVVGVEANKLLYRMHGVVTGARNSIIGYYSRDKKNALYLSSFENSKQAEKALKQMSAKIVNTTAGFTPAVVERAGGTVFYKTTGRGLNHVYYQQENFVVWWQVEPEKARDIVAQIKNLRFTVQ